MSDGRGAHDFSNHNWPLLRWRSRIGCPASGTGADKALAWMAVLGTAAARADTTYFYTGSPYTAINTGLIPCSPSPCSPLPNPNAAADAALFGTNLTGFITFGIDTTGLTETFNDLFTAPITAAGFASGD